MPIRSTRARQVAKTGLPLILPEADGKRRTNGYTLLEQEGCAYLRRGAQHTLVLSRRRPERRLLRADRRRPGLVGAERPDWQRQRTTRARDPAQYRRSLSRNVVRGMGRVAAEGRWVYGHAPYGLIVRDHRLVIDEGHPERVEAIRRIFELCLAGDGFGMIAAGLTRRQVEPPRRDETDKYRSRPGHAWADKHVANILRNRAYVGDVVFQRKVVARNAHPAIIDEITFERAQRAIASRVREKRTGNPIRQGRPSLFTPWARCGVCGGPMRIQPGGSVNRPPTYLNSGHRLDNKEACTGVNVRTDVLDDGLLDALATSVLTADGVKVMMAASIDRLSATGGE